MKTSIKIKLVAYIDRQNRIVWRSLPIDVIKEPSQAWVFKNVVVEHVIFVIDPVAPFEVVWLDRRQTLIRHKASHNLDNNRILDRE